MILEDIRKPLKICIVIFGILICFVSESFAQTDYNNCEYWQSQVNPEIKISPKSEKSKGDFISLLKQTVNVSRSKGFDELNEKQIYFGVECLLKLQGNKSNSSLSITRFDAEINPELKLGYTTVEVASLYYISYLIHQEWGHSEAAFLVDVSAKPKSDGQPVDISKKLNTTKTISKAYKSYRKWFKKIKRIGLEEARKQKLDPLNETGISWYRRGLIAN